MKTFRISGPWLLSVPLLLGVLGCNSSPHKAQQQTVNISACKADPDLVEVYEGDTLTWTNNPPDGNTYTVRFKKRKPIPNSTAPTGQGQKIKKDLLCSVGGWINPSACEYPYDIIQDNSSTACSDPGVHIVP